MKTAPNRLKRLHESAATLRKIPDSSIDKAELIGALHSDPSDVVRHEAAFLIGDVLAPNDRDAIKALISAANDSSILVRHEVALAFAKFPCSISALDVLLKKLIFDPVTEVRDSARFAIEELLGDRAWTE